MFFLLHKEGASSSDEDKWRGQALGPGGGMGVLTRPLTTPSLHNQNGFFSINF